jgi:hypothetical protein
VAPGSSHPRWRGDGDRSIERLRGHEDVDVGVRAQGLVPVEVRGERGALELNGGNAVVLQRGREVAARRRKQHATGSRAS